MSNDIYLIGEVGYEVNLKDLIEKVNSSDKSKPINIHIHSEGGYVYEGRAIYNYLKTLDQEVNTYAVGLVASSATIIMLAGKNKYAYNQNNVLIHMPSNFGGGNAKDFEMVAKELRAEEDKISQIYVDETGFTKEEAISLMNEDRMMTNSEIQKFGLVIKKYKAVAKLGQIKEVNKMSDNKETSIKEDIRNLLKELGIGGTKKEQPKNIVVKTASQDELNFPQVEEGSEPQVGDEATINGEKPEGEYVINERLTYVFENGVLAEVKEATEEEETTEEPTIEDETAKLKAEIESLKEQLNAKATIENSLTEKETQIKDLETKYNDLNETHTTMINKLESFSSQEVVETEQEQKKEVNNKKLTWNEKIKSSGILKK